MRSGLYRLSFHSLPSYCLQLKPENKNKWKACWKHACWKHACWKHACFQHVFTRNLFSCSIRKDACAHFVLLWHRALATGSEPWDVIWLLLRRCGATVAETLSAWFFWYSLQYWSQHSPTSQTEEEYSTRWTLHHRCAPTVPFWATMFEANRVFCTTACALRCEILIHQNDRYSAWDHVSQFGIWCRSMSLSTGTKLTIPPCKKYWTRNIFQKLRAQFFDRTLLLRILFHFPPPLVSYSHDLNKLATCCYSCLNMLHIQDRVDTELTGQCKQLDRFSHMSPIEEWLDPHWLT